MARAAPHQTQLPKDTEMRDPVGAETGQTQGVIARVRFSQPWEAVPAGFVMVKSLLHPRGMALEQRLISTRLKVC